MGLRLLSFFLLSCLLMVSSADAGVATYTLSGGTISGTLDGVSFTGANYTITANADPSEFVPGTLMGAPLLSQPAVSFMTIQGFDTFEITEANFGPFLLDASSVFVPGAAYAGFAYPTNGSLDGFAVLGTMSRVSSDVTVTGSLAPMGQALATSAGSLQILSATGIATFNGEFPSSAVPEPTSMAIFGLGALGMAYRARRKLKA